MYRESMPCTFHISKCDQHLPGERSEAREVYCTAVQWLTSFNFIQFQEKQKILVFKQNVWLIHFPYVRVSGLCKHPLKSRTMTNVLKLIDSSKI